MKVIELIDRKGKKYFYYRSVSGKVTDWFVSPYAATQVKFDSTLQYSIAKTGPNPKTQVHVLENLGGYINSFYVKTLEAGEAVILVDRDVAMHDENLVENRLL